MLVLAHVMKVSSFNCYELLEWSAICCFIIKFLWKRILLLEPKNTSHTQLTYCATISVLYHNSNLFSIASFRLDAKYPRSLGIMCVCVCEVILIPEGNNSFYSWCRCRVTPLELIFIIFHCPELWDTVTQGHLVKYPKYYHLICMFLYLVLSHNVIWTDQSQEKLATK